MWTEHACNGPSTCERVLYVWTGPPTDIGFSTCEWDHSPRQCHKTRNSYKHFHMPCHTSQGLIIYHAMTARPYIIPIPYAIPLQAIPYNMPCSPSDILYHAISRYHTHAMSARPYPIPCQTSPGHTIYHAMPTRPYQVPCHTSPGHTICHAMPDRRYHIPCHISLGHIIWHAIPGRPYPIQCHAHKAIPYSVPYLARASDIPCHVRQTIPCHTPPDNNIHHALPARPHHISCHAR